MLCSNFSALPDLLDSVIGFVVELPRCIVMGDFNLPSLDLQLEVAWDSQPSRQLWTCSRLLMTQLTVGGSIKSPWNEQVIAVLDRICQEEGKGGCPIKYR